MKSMSRSLLMTRQEAAAHCRVSLDTFEKYIQSEVKMVRLGRRKYVLVADLERWAEETARRLV